jgi:hypothetical protein
MPDYNGNSENTTECESKDVDLFLQLEDHLKKHNIFSRFWDSNPSPFKPTVLSPTPLVPIFPDSSQSLQETMRFDDDPD